MDDLSIALFSVEDKLCMINQPILRFFAPEGRQRQLDAQVRSRMLFPQGTAGLFGDLCGASFAAKEAAPQDEASRRR